MIRNSKKASAAHISDAYFDLVKRHPLRSIRSEGELDAAQAFINLLLQRELDEGATTYLDALSDLVILYERERHPVLPLPPQELLNHMLEERSMSQADLARVTGLAKATVSDLVTGKRSFTVRQMHIISRAFGLPGRVFMPEAV